MVEVYIEPDKQIPNIAKPKPIEKQTSDCYSDLYLRTPKLRNIKCLFFQFCLIISNSRMLVRRWKWLRRFIHFKPRDMLCPFLFVILQWQNSDLFWKAGAVNDNFLESSRSDWSYSITLNKKLHFGDLKMLLDISAIFLQILEYNTGFSHEELEWLFATSYWRFIFVHLPLRTELSKLNMCFRKLYRTV